MSRPLLILDLDETLIHTVERETAASADAPSLPATTRPADFTFDRFDVFKRPFLNSFLARANACFERIARRGDHFPGRRGVGVLLV